MRKDVISVLVLAVTGLAVWFFGETEYGNKGKKKSPVTNVAEAVKKVNLDGNTATYGSHTYMVNGENVTFTNIPSDYSEFEAVYCSLLGKSDVGVTALVPIVMEMYARDSEVGRQCIELICTPSQASTMIRSLQSKFTPATDDGNDPYVQRYLPSALLSGATATNGYAPTEPYTVVTKESVNKPQSMSLGTVSYRYIMSKGWDTEQRGVEILKPDNEELYKLFNCPACYTQCKNIKGTWHELK